MAEGHAQSGREARASQSRIVPALPAKDRPQQLHEKGSGPLNARRLNLPAVQSPLGDPAKMQGNGNRQPSYGSLAELTESLKLDTSPARSPPRPASLLESPFKRPPALLGPFPSGMQSPEVIAQRCVVTSKLHSKCWGIDF